MKTVHIIFNSHIDPIWLWSWRDGLDEVLNTCRFICDLLDKNPDIIYTRGEAWVYEKILQIDPDLFKRIHNHITAGRWSPVGGWYIQPDCNQPSGFALERQISIGKDFFKKHFGDFPKVAYNVDSFGHAASFPRYISKSGQSYYVMMRPGEHEMHLPARIFRWREKKSGPEIITFRIADPYCGMAEEKTIQNALSQLPEGVNHTMAFIGIGDHGGGPTQKMIDWCREHQNTFPDAKLVFSSPERFFSAVQKDIKKFPLVVGELQMHAVGCYSVHHRVKSLLKKAEHALVQAESVIGASPSEAEPRVKDAMEIAWKRVCFHHFHDTLGGTCLPSAYREIEAQLGQALAIADEEGTLALRQIAAKFPGDKYHRLIFFNASDKIFNDHVEIEPWLEWTPWQSSWGIADEKGKLIPYQAIDSETGVSRATLANQIRLVFRVHAKPQEIKVLRIVDAKDEKILRLPELKIKGERIRTKSGVEINLEKKGHLLFPLQKLSLPSLALYDDPTDTWSHGIDRYKREGCIEAKWERAAVLDRGTLMAALIQKGSIGSSELLSEWRAYQDVPWIEWVLRVNWLEKKRVLKMEWNLPKIQKREDGILGGSLRRSLNGQEYPLRDWTKLGIGGAEVAVIAPDVYALDVEGKRVGFTLLRGAVLACHDPNPGTHLRAVYSDRGETSFRFRFLVAPSIKASWLDEMAYAMQRPLLSMEMTKGMKTKFEREQYLPLRLKP